MRCCSDTTATASHWSEWAWGEANGINSGGLQLVQPYNGGADALDADLMRIHKVNCAVSTCFFSVCSSQKAASRPPTMTQVQFMQYAVDNKAVMAALFRSPVQLYFSPFDVVD